MIGLFERTLSYFLLLLVVALSPVAVQAQQKDDNLAAALQEARNAGVLETTVDRLLALGYEKQVEPSTMGNFLAILTQCRRENLPLQPFLSKIEEGITKKVPTTRIEEVLRNKLEDYRFTRSLIEKFLKRHDQAESIAPEYLVRIAETLYCGVSRQDLTKLLGEFPLVPLPVVAKGAEILASLRQIRFDPKLSEQIVDSGVRHGYFTAAQRDFARIIAVAEEKGLKDEQIAVVALKVIEKGESQADFLAQLGIGAEDLERRGPQLGDSRPGWAKHMNQVSDGASGKGREAAPSRGGEQAASGSPTAKASSTTPSRGGEQVGPVSAPGSASATTPGGSVSTPGSAPGGGSGPATSSQLGEAKPPHPKKPVRFAAAGVVASIRPAHATMTLEIEKASRILKGRIGETVKFVISDSVKVKSEGSEPGVFDLDLSEIKAKESYVRVLGKKLAGRVYLITHIVVSMNGEAEAQEEEAIEFTALGSATLIDPPGLTLTLRIENADGVLDGRTGETVTFGVREDVQIKAESPTASLFGLTLHDLQAEEGYLKVLGKELAAGDYLITHIEIALDE